MTLPTQLQTLRGEMKKSRAKIWIRTGLLAIFGTLFGFGLARDIAAGAFHWTWGLAVLLACLPVGLAMSRIVPMRAEPKERFVTLSFDRTYFILIWLLVIAKFVTAKIPGLSAAADVIMCTILGIMAGRLSGICLRVRDLKIQNNFSGGRPA